MPGHGLGQYALAYLTGILVALTYWGFAGMSGYKVDALSCIIPAIFLLPLLLEVSHWKVRGRSSVFALWH